MARQRVSPFHHVSAATAAANSHLRTGAQVSPGSERAGVVALRGGCRPDAAPVPLHVGPLVLHSSSKLCTARHQYKVVTSQVQRVAIFLNDFLILISVHDHTSDRNVPTIVPDYYLFVVKLPPGCGYTKRN